MSLLKHSLSSIRTFFAGFCMGCADVVPGVSGGTVALVLGVYERLIQALRNVGQAPFAHALFRGRLVAAAKAIDATFLVTLAAGIGAAILTVSRYLEHALETYPQAVWSTFFGLVLASACLVSMRVRQWNTRISAAVVIGAVGAFFLVGLVPVETPNTPWFLVLSGAIAICAMILPGISGSFILVLLGKYAFILSAVNERDVLSLGLVAMGAVLGLLLFAQVLGSLFKYYHDTTLGLMTGFMFGSLRRLWPWQTVADNGQFDTFWPNFGSGGVPNTDTLKLIAFMAMGALIILVLHHLGQRIASSDTPS